MSLFGDDGMEDILNANINEEQQGLPSDDDAPNENAADAEKPIKVEPKKRQVRNPRHRLTVELLCGPRGIHTIEEYYKDIKFKGKGHEREDLDEIMRRLQHWAHRLYPSYKFDEVLDTIEHLGKKKPLQVHMSRYRLGLLESMQQMEAQAEKTAADDDDDDDIMTGVNGMLPADEPFDEFDALLGQQIAMSKLDTPTHGNRSAMSNMTASTATFAAADNVVMSTPHLHDSDLARPLPDSPPTTSQKARDKFTAEQRERMAENRRMAQEILRAKREQQQQQQMQS